MGTSLQDLKIEKYINVRFDDYVHHEIDFVRHSKPDASFTKEVSHHANGRPIIAEYFDSLGVKMCQRRFEIVADSSSLMTDKKVWLSYVKKDGSNTEEFLIDWSLLKPLEHAADRLRERKQARQWILDDIEIQVAGVLSFVLNKTIEEIEALTAGYFDLYDREIRYFVKKGNSGWIDSLQNDDLSAYSAWMLDIPAWSGANLKTYLISRLSY